MDRTRARTLICFSHRVTWHHGIIEINKCTLKELKKFDLSHDSFLSWDKIALFENYLWHRRPTSLLLSFVLYIPCLAVSWLSSPLALPLPSSSTATYRTSRVVEIGRGSASKMLLNIRGASRRFSGAVFNLVVRGDSRADTWRGRKTEEICERRRDWDKRKAEEGRDRATKMLQA